MTSALELYIVLVLAGLFLIGAEIFLPGGIIGVLGTFALIGAIVVGFFAFGQQGGLLSALGIIVLAGICLAIWIKYFPKTGMGKRLTLQKTGSSFKAPAADLATLVGKEGVTLSILRPSGIAKIDGRRVDVIADGDWIQMNKPVKVVQVEGFRVLVREIPPSGEKKEGT